MVISSKFIKTKQIKPLLKDPIEDRYRIGLIQSNKFNKETSQLPFERANIPLRAFTNDYNSYLHLNRVQ